MEKDPLSLDNFQPSEYFYTPYQYDWQKPKSTTCIFDISGLPNVKAELKRNTPETDNVAIKIEPDDFGASSNGKAEYAASNIIIKDEMLEEIFDNIEIKSEIDIQESHPSDRVLRVVLRDFLVDPMTSVPVTLKDFSIPLVNYRLPYPLPDWVQKIVICPDCTPDFDGKKSYFECQWCFYVFLQKSHLRNHIIYHHRDKINRPLYKCKECPFVGKASSNLTIHIRKVHLKIKIPAKKRTYYCKETGCTFQTMFKPKMEEHQAKVHTALEDVQWFECYHCSKKFHTRHQIYMHMTNVHDLNRKTTFHCPECEFTAFYKKELKIHKYTHMSQSNGCRIFKCSHCSYVAKFKNNLMAHLNRKHTDKSGLDVFKCDLCLYESVCSLDVQNHKKIHNEKNVSCTKCNFKTKSTKCLRAHVLRLHDSAVMSEVKLDFACIDCDFRCVRRKELVIHKKTVHKFDPDEGTFACEKCSYVARRKYQLCNHKIRKHNDPATLKYLKCNVCNFETARPADLRAHAVNVHNKASVLCEMCGFQTTAIKYLYAHHWRYHREVENE